MKESLEIHYAQYRSNPNKESLNALLQSSYEEILQKCKRTGYDHHDAEDATQETLIKLAKQAPKTKSFRHFINSLFLTTKHTCINQHRRRKRFERIRDLLENQPTPTNSDPIEQEIADLLDQVCKESKQLLIDYYLTGYSSEKMASDNHCSRATIHRKMRQAANTIRQKSTLETL